MTPDTYKRLFLLCALILPGFFNSATAQIRCGTVEYQKHLEKKYPNLQKTDQFEKWMAAQVTRMRSRQITADARTESVTYTIPIVFHVIHNGEAVGHGANISDAQIQSQVDALNRDYPRLNADSVNTPDRPGARFREVAGKINIRFVLARQDPEGVASNGITRTKGGQTIYYEDEDDAKFKNLIDWPPDNYLNIWVVNLGGGLLGYTILPQGSGLDGLDFPAVPDNLDGVVLNYQVCGDNSNGQNFALLSAYAKGRTGTHEVGHFLGLRHIWGDKTDCSGSDYCADTPSQADSTSGCPHPISKVTGGVTTVDSSTVKSCLHPKMFQNYMDYTDDACYNLFTKDQISRMIVVLGNSPRRASLLSSPGAVDPTLYPNDLGVRKIQIPGATACADTPVTPTVQIRNYGNNSITSATVQFSVNNVVVETRDFTLNLASLDTTDVTFSPVTFVASVTYSLTAAVLSTNAGTDGNTTNDSFTATTTARASIALPFVEQFNSLPASWLIINPDASLGGVGWANVTAPYTIPTNTAMYMDFYDYDDQGQQDRLVTPVFDLSTATAATLKFDHAYATFGSSFADQLRIVISTSCDTRNETELYNKSGTALATAPSSNVAFVPTSSGEWKTESIDLSPFLGMSNLQITFIGINQNGNNLYIDNVNISTEAYTDLVVSAIKNPSPVSCISVPVPVITISNLGSLPITSFTVSSTVNSGTADVETFNGLNLVTGQDMDVTLSKSWNLNSGINTVLLSVTTPGTDINPANNSFSLNVVSNSEKVLIPFAETFDDNFPEWSVVNPRQGTNWTAVATGSADKKISMEYAAFANSALGDQTWLVSPVLALDNITNPGLSFDLSYYQNVSGIDRLQVFGSTDCGITYPQILFDQVSDSLTVRGDSKTSSSWRPQQDDDWSSRFVSLVPLAGSSTARVAFVFTNGDGNNVFLDNVGFVLKSRPDQTGTDPLFSVYNNMTPDVRVTFNLPAVGTVRIQVSNGLGQSVLDETIDGVLHETFPIDLNGKQAGVYIIRLQMGSTFGSAKAVIGN